MRDIWHISIHCSASDVASHDNVETIRKWHVEERGWSDIGYHFIITKNGDIHECRPITRTPAAVKNNNSGNIAICLTGKDEFTESQFKSLRQLVRNLQFDYQITDDNVKGHNEYLEHKSRKCPNFNVQKVLKTIE